MRLIIVTASLLAVFSAVPARAWSEKSHMTTGAIAFDDLSATDPVLLARLETIVAAHPHYAAIASHANGLKGPARMRVIFEWLARWPDDANGTAFEHRSWHYELRVVHGRTWLWPFRNGEASAAFDANFRTLADVKTPLRDRAVALSWLMHIVGDIQQPLHAGHQMTSTFSRTDEAGSLAYVRNSKGSAPCNLHQYWDKSLDVPGPVDATANAWSGALEKLWPRARGAAPTYSGTPQAQFGKWLDESMQLARLVGYSGTALAATATVADAPVVTPREIHIVEALSRRRVATAGYRIADTIRMALR